MNVKYYPDVKENSESLYDMILLRWTFWGSSRGIGKGRVALVGKDTPLV